MVITWKEISVNVIRIMEERTVKLSLLMKNVRILGYYSLMIMEDKSNVSHKNSKIKRFLFFRCLCLANYVDDDCLQSKNSNITNITYFLNLQMRKTHPTQTKNLLTHFGDKNWSKSFTETQLLKELDQKTEIKDIFNIEIKKATEYLNNVKPNYQRVLSEYQDFFGSNIFIFFHL